MSATFTDMHNHTLPGVDDGPQELDDALTMASIAAKDGIATVVLTPHNRDVVALARDGSLPRRVDQLREAVAEDGTAVRFFLGMENHLELDLPQQVERGLALPINGTKYILVELPFVDVLPLYTQDTLFQLQLKGLVPIIAHAERCDALVAEPDLLEGFVRRGMLAQVTVASITGLFGRDYEKAAEHMLRRGLVHIIATDAHMARGPRVPVMSDGVRAAARIVGEERALEMASAVPQAIIEGRPVPAGEPRPPKRRFSLFR
ncbi:MAG: CpsB/CapC family capsule biosynthesis tyrosine phosphatase [Dehalococcoidia bacterium]